MDGRLENGFLLLVLAVIFLCRGLLRLDKKRRYKDAAELRGRVLEWNCYRGWQGSMSRKYWEIAVETERGTCIIRTNSGKARKYRHRKDITVLVPQLTGVWEALAQLSANRMRPQSEWHETFHRPQETGVLLSETRPRTAEILALLALGGLFLFLSILCFAGVLP